MRLARIDGYGNPRTGELWMRSTPVDGEGRELAPSSATPAANDPETGAEVQVVTQALAGFCTVTVKADGVENSNPPGTFEFYTKGQLAGAPMSDLSSFDAATCYGNLTAAEKTLHGPLIMSLFGPSGTGVGCAYQHVGNFSGRNFDHVYLDIDVFNGDEAKHGAYGAPFTTGTVDTPGGRNTPNSNKGLWDFGPMTNGQLADMWIYFKNGDATDFNWTGYLLGEIHETCGNSIDDDCDGVVDNDCNDFVLDEECFDDDDCGSG